MCETETLRCCPTTVKTTNNINENIKLCGRYYVKQMGVVWHFFYLSSEGWLIESSQVSLLKMEGLGSCCWLLNPVLWGGRDQAACFEQESETIHIRSTPVVFIHAGTRLQSPETLIPKSADNHEVYSSETVWNWTAETPLQVKLELRLLPKRLGNHERVETHGVSMRNVMESSTSNRKKKKGNLKGFWNIITKLLSVSINMMSSTPASLALQLRQSWPTVSPLSLWK